MRSRALFAALLCIAIRASDDDDDDGTDVLEVPTSVPTNTPTMSTLSPTSVPTAIPTSAPTFLTLSPTGAPTAEPTSAPTTYPTAVPTTGPTFSPSAAPSSTPTDTPTWNPTKQYQPPTAAPITFSQSGDDDNDGVVSSFFDDDGDDDKQVSQHAKQRQQQIVKRLRQNAIQAKQNAMHKIDPQTLMHVSKNSIENIEKEQKLQNIMQAEEKLNKPASWPNHLLIIKKVMSVVRSEREQSVLETDANNGALKMTDFKVRG
jgi:hypothetical protein